MTKQHAFTREDLLRCSRGELFGPGNAQLPAPNMLMVDRIVHISEVGGKYGKGELVAELDINPDLWFFACHFEGDPVMPGCLGLDAMWQLVGFYLGWQGSLAIVLVPLQDHEVGHDCQGDDQDRTLDIHDYSAIEGERDVLTGGTGS